MTRARDLAAFVSNADGDIKFDTDTLFIDSSANRVGIGTTTPSEQINLVGSSGASKIRFDGDSSNLQNNFIGITGYDDLIIASDEANSGSASTIQFKVDGTERMRIDSGGDVGIATTSITGAFHVDKAVQGSPIATFHNTSGNTSGDAGIEVETSTTATYIQRWVNAGSEKARILANGGLTFNGDTAAANALDDYETGTCTLTSPSSVANSTGVAHAYANFTKIGNLVTIQGAFDSVNHNSGRIAFTAHVPFAMATASNTGQLGVCSIYPNSTDESSGYILNNTGSNNTQIYFEMQADASNSSGTVSYNLSYRAA